MAEQPDPVAVQFEWHVGPAGSVGKREQFSELKIPTYISPSDCVAKDNTVGGDGVRRRCSPWISSIRRSWTLPGSST